jgi:hypothetical protein
MSMACVPSGQPFAVLAETMKGKKRSAELLQAFTKLRKCEHEDLGFIVLQAAISAARTVLQTQSSEPADPGDAMWQAFASELMVNTNTWLTILPWKAADAQTCSSPSLIR